MIEFCKKQGLRINIKAVIAYKPLELIDYNKIPYLKVLRYNEMWNRSWTKKEILESGTHLVICHHMNDLREFEKMDLKLNNGQNVVYKYIAHCAEHQIFKDYNMEKKYDIMLGGCLSPEYYPLRSRFIKILGKMSSKYKTYLHKHPGYDLQDAHTNKYLIEFAQAINQSKLVLSCASKFNYRLGKYVEVPACGSVLVADKPYDEHDNYDYMITINNDMTDNEIENILVKYLEDEKIYEEKRKKGLEFSKDYTQLNYAKKLYNNIEEYLETF